MSKTRWASTTFREVTITVPDHAVELAYLAGIFDGEGSVSRLKKGQRRWSVSISTTDLGLLDRLHTIGGRSYATVGNALGKKVCWRWEIVAARDVRFFLEALFPYLLIKKSLAKAAITEITSWIDGANDREAMV